MHSLLKAAFFTAGALVLVGPVIAQDNSGRRFTVDLTGAEEPSGGDEDGSGTFTARVNPGLGQLCYTLTATDIATATAAHIHEAEAGVAGPVVIPLSAPASGTVTECISADREELVEILREPEEYYVNVHNAEFPAGAIRGQLSR